MRIPMKTLGMISILIGHRSHSIGQVKTLFDWKPQVIVTPGTLYSDSCPGRRPFLWAQMLGGLVQRRRRRAKFRPVQRLNNRCGGRVSRSTCSGKNTARHIPSGFNPDGCASWGDVEAGEQGQAPVGHQGHDMTFALQRPEFEGQAGAQGMGRGESFWNPAGGQPGPESPPAGGPDGARTSLRRW